MWGFSADHEFNVRWLKAARRVLKPDGTLWVSGLGGARRLGPRPPPGR